MDTSQWGEQVDGIVVDEATPVTPIAATREVGEDDSAQPSRRRWLLGRTVGAVFGAITGAWPSTGLLGRLVLLGALLVGAVVVLIATVTLAPTLIGVVVGFLIAQPFVWPVLVVLAGWGIARRLDGDRPGPIAYLRRLATTLISRTVVGVYVAATLTWVCFSIYHSQRAIALAERYPELGMTVSAPSYPAVAAVLVSLLALTAVVRDRWSS